MRYKVWKQRTPSLLTLSFVLIQHDPAYIFNVNHVLCFKELNDWENNFFFNPYKGQPIYH